MSSFSQLDSHHRKKPVNYFKRVVLFTAAAALLSVAVAAPTTAAAASKKPLTDRVSVRTGGSIGSTVVNSGDQETGERRLLSKDGRFSVFASASELKG